jgi:hypothetical protein
MYFKIKRVGVGKNIDGLRFTIEGGSSQVYLIAFNKSTNRYSILYSDSGLHASQYTWEKYEILEHIESGKWIIRSYVQDT